MNVEEFNLLKPNQKRVVIAKDVIKQLDNNKIIAGYRGYFYNEALDDFLDDNWDDKYSLKKLLPDYKCTVCAMGALFVSDVLLTNKAEISNSTNEVDDTTIIKKLRYFSAIQLKLIEAFYEGYLSRHDGVYEFYNKYSTAESRMIGIMKNIISNNGTFKP